MTQNVQPAGGVLTNYGIVAWIVYGVLSGGSHWTPREQAPREVWDHPLFMHLNVILTVSFGRCSRSMPDLA